MAEIQTVADVSRQQARETLALSSPMPRIIPHSPPPVAEALWAIATGGESQQSPLLPPEERGGDALERFRRADALHGDGGVALVRLDDRTLCLGHLREGILG